jgi:DNA repair protein RadC
MAMKSLLNRQRASIIRPTMAEEKDEKPHHVGHRARLRERFLKAGGKALPDYELLELVLFLALPRRDVKPLAKSLLATFGSFADVISAEPAELHKVKGMGDTTVVALKSIQAAAHRLLNNKIMDRPVLSNWQALIDYCYAAMAYEKNEQLRVLFLNTKNILIADEIQQRGTVDHTPVYTREVVKRALELNATAIILVHNHPSGDHTPSPEDIDKTKEIRDAGAKLGIALHDHIIVSKSGTNSFKSMGLI